MSLATLIPKPKSVTETHEGPFFITEADRVQSEGADGLQAVVRRVSEALKLGDVTTSEDGRIQLVLNEPGAGESTPESGAAEAYTLKITPDLVTLSASSEKGLHRGSETLAQLLVEGDLGEKMLPACAIEDEPRYGWRGISMDVSRTFYPVEEIQGLIDLLSLYRMNTLHLHLSDDQGWRLEVQELPKLTSISGKTAGDGNRAGFYTTRDFENIVQYAADRGIDVIAEFDIPGHTNAATHAYGELTPSGEPTAAYSGSKVGFSVLYPDVPFTDTFLEDVFTTAAKSTSSPYVHIGGDEALEQPKDQYDQLIEKAAAVVTGAGKKPVAWQEAASAELPDGAVLQWWRPQEDPAQVVKAAGEGAKVLMSPAPHAYLDLKYDAATPYGQDWAGFVELKDSYDWDPAAEIEGVEDADVIGVEAGMWTEYIRDYEQLMYMLLPRIPALAEVAWTEQSERDYDDFTSRIGDHPKYWDARGLKWHASPGVNWRD